MAGRDLFERTEFAACIYSGEPTDPVENDVAEEDDDTRLPPGWLKLTLSRVVPNPAYVEEQAKVDQVERVRAHMIEQQLAQVPAEAPEEQMAEIRATTEMIVAAQIPLPSNDEPEFLVETFEYPISPAFIDRLVALELPGFTG